MIDNPESL